MERANASARSAALLPLDTVVGAWRVVAWQGMGVYGAVYRAVRVGQEDAGPVALKLGMWPRDPRFAREVALLNRVRHPSIPRLLDEGTWQHPGGTLHPFIVMEWVEGTPLYEWVREHHAHPERVLRPLAQLARALQALHAEGAIHRDVKGDNVRIRHQDGRAMLLDFGSGIHEGAATLTPQRMFPGTPAYRSPESYLFELRHWRDPAARYRAGPADDLYALGVTAYRLVTGEYPEVPEPRQDEAGTWQLEGTSGVPPQSLNPQVEPQFSALIVRMLSVDPAARGTVEEMAEALERAAEQGAPEAGEPLETKAPPPFSARLHEENAAPSVIGPPTGVESVVEPLTRQEDAVARVRPGEPSPEQIPGVGAAGGRIRPRAHVRLRRSLLMAVVASLALVAWGWWTVSGRFELSTGVVQGEGGGEGFEEGGKAGLGDATAPSFPGANPESSAQGALTEDPLPKPSPGQERPDANGRCSNKQQVAINGGCWIEIPDREQCQAILYVVFQGKCYAPARPRGRQPTSIPETPR